MKKEQKVIDQELIAQRLYDSILENPSYLKPTLDSLDEDVIAKIDECFRPVFSAKHNVEKNKESVIENLKILTRVLNEVRKKAEELGLIVEFEDEETGLQVSATYIIKYL